MEREILSVPEALEFLGISRSLLFRLMRERAIPFVKIRKRVVFIKADLLSWLKSQSVK